MLRVVERRVEAISNLAHRTEKQSSPAPYADRIDVDLLPEDLDRSDVIAERNVTAIADDVHVSCCRKQEIDEWEGIDRFAELPAPGTVFPTLQMVGEGALNQSKQRAVSCSGPMPECVVVGIVVFDEVADELEQTDGIAGVVDVTSEPYPGRLKQLGDEPASGVRLVKNDNGRRQLGEGEPQVVKRKRR